MRLKVKYFYHINIHTFCYNFFYLVSIEEPSTSSHLNDAEETKNNARTAVNPNFLSEFYNNSRLHHISQLGAAFKEYVNHLRENSDFSFPGRDFLLENKLEV